MFRHSSRSQRGFTLPEVLISIAVFTIIFVAALAIYDQSNKVFKRGVEAAEMQQNVRIAFDKMVADVRMAGFDYDRDGIPTGSAGFVWQPNRAYGVGDLVSPSVANGFVYRCTVAGTSGAGEPTPWPTSVGGTKGDNGITWTAQAGVNQYEQPDEQIEYAGPSALTIRANYDYELNEASDRENGREPALESAQFPVVTTGNDEIVTYALRSDRVPASGCNTATNCIEFYADVTGSPGLARKSYPGGSVEDRIRITNVDLGDTTSTGCTPTAPCFNNPPYTLMRFTLDDNGNQVDTPLANNIRSMRFEYYPNVTGVTPTTAPSGWADTTQVGTNATAGAGQYDPAQPTTGLTQRAARQQIKSVRVTLIGMNESFDANYQNPKEATTSYAYRYRTYRLESLLVPRNLGKQGVREIPPTPPGAPVLQAITDGYCGTVRLDWLAPAISPGQGGVESYKILYNNTGSTTIFPFVQDVGPNTSGFVTGLNPTTNYTFTVAAVNSYGTQIALVPGTTNTATVSSTPINTTTPGNPTGLTGSGGGGANPAAEANQIRIRWTQPTNSTGSATRRPIGGGNTTISNPNEVFGEIVTYNIWRTSTGVNCSTTPASCTLVSSLTQNTLQLTSTTGTFIDKTSLNCIPYQYYIQAVEQCGKTSCAGCNSGGAQGKSGVVGPVQGQSTASSNPAPPATLTVNTAASSCGPGSNPCNIQLQFSKVSQDTSTPPNGIAVGTYVLERTRYIQDATSNWIVDPDTTNGPAVQNVYVTDATPYDGQLYVTYNDFGLPSKGPSPPPLPGQASYQYWYRVQAAQCPDNPTTPTTYMFSDINASQVAKFPCAFTGLAPSVTVTFTMDGDGLTPSSAWLTNNPQSQVQVDGAGLSQVQAFLDNGSTLVNLGTLTSPTSGISYLFPLSGTDVGEVYNLFVVAKDAAGCSITLSRWIEEATPTGCCLSNSQTDASVVSYTPGTTFVDITFRNLCSQDLAIQANGIVLIWDPVIARNGIANQLILTTVELPSTGTGSAVVTKNDDAGTTSTTLRTVTVNPGSATPTANTTITKDSNTYTIRVNFNRALNNGQSPVTGACVIYQRVGVDTANQNCKILNGPPVTFNTCSP